MIDRRMKWLLRKSRQEKRAIISLPHIIGPKPTALPVYCHFLALDCSGVQGVHHNPRLMGTSRVRFGDFLADANGRKSFLRSPSCSGTCVKRRLTSGVWHKRLYNFATARKRMAGAGEGNRTPVCSLGSCRSAIELHPR